MSNGILDWLIGDIDYLRGHTSMESVSTDEASLADRPMESTGDRTITVDAAGGGDYTTAQEGFNQIPRRVEHTVTIDLQGGDYSDEYLWIPPFVTNPARGAVIIEGDRATPSNVKFRGVKVAGAYAKRLPIRGIQFEGKGYATDGPSSVQVDGGMVVVDDCNFNNSTGEASRAITAYGGRVLIKGETDFGANAYDKGVVVKNMGSFAEAGSATITGNVNARAYEFQNAEKASLDSQSNLTSDGAKVVTIDAVPWVWDSSQNTVTHVYVDNDDKRRIAGLKSETTFEGTDTTLDVESYRTIHVDSDAAHTWTLPAAPAGEEVVIKDSDGNAGTNTQTIQSDAGTIDGGASVAISTNWGWRRLVQVQAGGGENWKVVGSN